MSEQVKVKKGPILPWAISQSPLLREVAKKASRPFDTTTALIEYEQGGLNDDQTIELFQRLVDTGLAWKLQGVYGRTAQRFIDAGLIHGKRDSAAPTVKEIAKWNADSTARKGVA